MNDSPPANNPEEQERIRAKRQIRRRLLGAAAIFLLVVLLWDVGSPLPAEPTFHSVPTTPENFLGSADDDEESSEGNLAVVPTAADDDGSPVATASVDSTAPSAPSAQSSEPSTKEKPTEPSSETMLRSEHQEVDTLSNADEAEPNLTSSIPPKVHLPSVTISETSADIAKIEKFIVQIGAFRRRERAVEIMNKLKAAKFTARIEPTQRNGVELLRVRAVGFDSRVEAEKARLQIIQLGYEHAIVIGSL